VESDDGFRSFSEEIASDPIGVLLAKWRRDAFIRKLMQLPDVVEVIPSGSLARGTHIGPVHDVDLIVVFDSDQHPDYGIRGRTKKAEESAAAAITHLEGELLEQLHPWRGAAGGLVKETEQRRHVVKYNGDWTGPFKDYIPAAPPVDVMPAVREGSHLLIPERETGWIDADPERLIRQVAQRQREWKYFTEVTGMVKAWAKLNDLKIKNLAVEAMILKYCPRPRLFETLAVGDAVARLFEAAAGAHITSLRDPAGRCGEIDPNINFGRLRRALDDARGLAERAMDAEHAWKDRHYAVGEVIHPDVYWRKLFGKEYPRTHKRFWREPAAEPWIARYTAEPAVGGPNRPDNPAPRRPPGGPKGPDGGGPSGPSGGGGSPKRPKRPSERPRPRPRVTDDKPRLPSGPRGPRLRPEPESAPAPAPAEPSASFWANVLGPATAAAAVPLTFG
jgi:hypothetical protein